MGTGFFGEGGIRLTFGGILPSHFRPPPFADADIVSTHPPVGRRSLLSNPPQGKKFFGEGGIRTLGTVPRTTP